MGFGLMGAGGFIIEGGFLGIERGFWEFCGVLYTDLDLMRMYM